MDLLQDLKPGPVGLDTSIFIYFIEEHPRFMRVLRPLFEAIDRGAIGAVTSGVTLMEVLVVPYRAGDEPLATRYEALLTGSRGLRMIELDRQVLRSAAMLRASLRLKPPDALQLAAALAAGCRSFLTNDRALPAPGGLTVRRLADYATG